MSERFRGIFYTLQYSANDLDISFCTLDYVLLFTEYSRPEEEGVGLTIPAA